MATGIKVDGQKILSVGKEYPTKITSWPKIDGEPVNKSLCYYDGTPVVKLKTQETLDSEQATKDIVKTDMDYIRVCDDLIDLFVSKKLILLSELPKKAQEKHKFRAELRLKIDN